MKFNNRENELHRKSNGKIFFESRSVAVTIYLYFKDLETDKIYLPIGQRKIGADRGKYGVISGYLDWDESLKDCVIRESYEEFGLNLRNYDLFQDSKQLQNPIILDNLNTRQDIVFLYEVILNINNKSELPKLENKDNEMCNLDFLEIEESILDMRDNIFAFNTKDVLKKFINKNKKEPN